LITVAPGAGYPDPGEGELIFNGHKWSDVWNVAGDSQIGINECNVTLYLNTTNVAAFQSSGDYMEASNAILVVGGSKQRTGDMDGNGEVTFDDVISLAKHIYFNEHVSDDPDVNSDGKVTFDDVISLAKHIYFNEPIYP